MHALVNAATDDLAPRDLAPHGFAVELREVQEPEPAPGEVVVEVRAMAINRGEIRLLAARPDGWRPGQDVAGVVSRAAADGSGPPEGTRVVAWPEQAGWAERVAVPSDLVAPIGDATTFSAAATLPVAGVTALRLLRAGGELLARRVLVTGAAGGVGRFAVELAARGGAQVTGVTRNADRAAGLTDLGAGEVVHDVEGTSGPFDVVLESVGGASLSAVVGRGTARLVAPRGVVLVFGNSSGESSTIDFRDFAGLGGARIEIFRVYESGQQPSFGEDLRRLVALVDGDRLHPQVGLEVSWTDANTALEALAARKVEGKAVLLVD